MSRTRIVPNGRTELRPLPTVPAFIATALVAPRAKLSDGEATRQMADDMRQAAYREGGVTRESLLLLGYTGAQIERLAATARRHAQAAAGMSL